MSLLKLASLSLLITLSFHTVVGSGEKFISSEINKLNAIKPPEKRSTNFRVPVDMPYDPNFWPARGRRSRRDPEKIIPNEKCITSDGNFICPQGEDSDQSERRKPLELEIPIELEEDHGKPGIECYESLPRKIIDEPRIGGGGLGMKVQDSLKRLNEQKLRNQRRFNLPQIILYENEAYWEPDNLYGEKKKKQDVFWVARGKKNFSFNLPQK